MSRILIAKAFQEFQNKTCIRFVPKSNEKDYIRIENDKGYVKVNTSISLSTEGLFNLKLYYPYFCAVIMVILFL